MSQHPPYPPEAWQTLLPHRPPFRFVDRVLELQPGCRILAELDLRPEDFMFRYLMFHAGASGEPGASDLRLGRAKANVGTPIVACWKF